MRLRAIFLHVWTAFLLTGPIAGQVITSDPAFPTLAGPVTVFFHADRGNAGLNDYTGDVYAHTGVITNLSNRKDGCGPGETDWRYVKTNWGQNTAETKLRRVEANLYALDIPDIRAYYGVSASEDILRLTFVFRSSDGQREGKDTGNCDIFLDITKQAVNVTFVEPVFTPLDPVIVSSDTTLQILAIATLPDTATQDLRLYVDGEQVASTKTDSLEWPLVLNSPGRVDVLAIAGGGGEQDTAAFYTVYRAETIEAVRPAGIVDGINYGADHSRVTLSLLAPYKSYIYVLGDFNDWQVDPAYQMQRQTVRDDNVHFWLEVTDLKPNHAYAFQYLVDGELRIADPYTEIVLTPEDAAIPAQTYPDLPAYPAGKMRGHASVLQTGRTPYAWQTENFQRPLAKDLVIYELLVRDFISRHDFATLTDSLDYFARLGINAIELMPPNEFEGNESWGYNPSYYFAPDKYYGPADDLKRFVDAAHARGIAVIMDIVLNHTYGQAPMVQLYFENGKPAANSPWYNVEHSFRNPAAHWGYDFDHESPATQAFTDRVLAYWLTEFRFDGFRFDFTKGFTNQIKPASGDNLWGSRYDASRIRLLKRMVAQMWQNSPGSYAIFEHLSENREEQELADFGILMWGNMNFNYNEATMGYHDGGKSDISWGYYRNRGWVQPNLVTYMESHDEERLMYKNLQFGNSSGNYSVKSLSVALDRNKLAGAFFFPIPGPKMIWQFGEVGYDISINEGCRICNKPIRWDYFADTRRRKLYDTWSALIRIRQSHDIFTNTSTQVNLDVRNSTKRISLVHPWNNNQVLIIGNFGMTETNAALTYGKTGTWYNFFEGTSFEVQQQQTTLSLLPGEFHVLMSMEPAFTPEPDLITVSVESEQGAVPQSAELHQNYPNPFNPSTQIAFSLSSAQQVKLEVYDLLGKQVATLVDGKMDVGHHHIRFDAAGLASGVYLYRLQTAEGIKTRRMVLMR